MAYDTATTPGAARPGAINVAVDPVALVVTECITVTSAMRKHARWAHSSVSAILGGGTSSRLEARRQDAQNGNKDSNALNVTDDVSLASRWGLRGKKGQSMQDNPLLSAFARLRSDLKRCRGMLRAFQEKRTWPNTTRHPQRRCAFDPTSFPPGHPLRLHLRTNHLSGSDRDHEVLRIQHHQQRLSATTTSHAEALFSSNTLPV